MKKAFQILKDRPQIELTVTRDSVCAADDCEAPHEKRIKIHSFVDPADLATATSSGYLPSIAGIGHSWTCELNGMKIAEIKNNGTDLLVKELTYQEENEVHFSYRSANY